MKVYFSLDDFSPLDFAVVTTGTFDGVHMGHTKILKQLIEVSKKHGGESVLLTFDPHPRMVLQPDIDLKLINSQREKIELLKNSGIDHLIIHPFTKEFSRLFATEFVRGLLVNKLKSKKIIIGYDHRFGRNRNANITDLISFGNALDFSVEEIPAQEIDDVSISSTKIRKALESGDVITANTYLGYEYMLTGIVKKGKGLGRQLNFPTANLAIAESYKLIPKTGTYTVKSVLFGKMVYGMMNIGYNPTVNGKTQSIEVHFFDFKEDLYNQKIQIDILHRLRDEHKFESLDALKEQLAKDRENSIEFISK